MFYYLETLRTPHNILIVVVSSATVVSSLRPPAVKRKKDVPEVSFRSLRWQYTQFSSRVLPCQMPAPFLWSSYYSFLNFIFVVHNFTYISDTACFIIVLCIHLFLIHHSFCRCLLLPQIEAYLFSQFLLLPQIEAYLFSQFLLLPRQRHTFQINHQPDATNFQFIILTFIYSSTRFGRFPAHHQELPWQPAGPTTNTARLSPRYEGKTRGCHCSH
jgi:hypothetical protein